MPAALGRPRLSTSVRRRLDVHCENETFTAQNSKQAAVGSRRPHAGRGDLLVLFLGLSSRLLFSRQIRGGLPGDSSWGRLRPVVCLRVSLALVLSLRRRTEGTRHSASPRSS